MTIWSILAVYVWKQLFTEWVYADLREELPKLVYEFGDNLFQVFPTLQREYRVRDI